MLEAIRSGGKRAVADVLARIEAQPDAPETAALLDAAFAEPKGYSLGLTGPPGVGKSTLIDALIRSWRGAGLSIGVIAVDPSSSRSGGALLGDRTRLVTDPADQGVFVRSMAARERLGGVAEITFPAMVLMRALYDVVIVETVGVGQSETAIAETADLVAFCAQPGSGDALQFMKAGIMEVPDIVIVTKADMGAVAERTVADLKGAVSLTAGGRAVSVLRCAAATGAGIADVIDGIGAVAAMKSPEFGDRRVAQLEAWCSDQIRQRFGQEGLNLVKNSLEYAGSSPSFSTVLQFRSRLSAAIRSACL